MSVARQLEVALGARSYPIFIGPDLIDAADLWRSRIGSRRVLVVSNTTVAPLYLERVRSALAAVGIDAAEVLVEDGEQFKTLASVARIFDALAAMGAERDATIVALGGGVVGDMAGFAAACWMRGIDFVQMPTTLLAMVDASVGGKTGVDLPAGKNLVGAFHQPRAVVIDTATLATLAERDYRAGLAEVIKHAAIGDAAQFAWLEQAIGDLGARDPAALATAIAHDCAYKAGVVARDETERGERALLNFGHTFGHALEAVTCYAALRHGEAVAIGMRMAARLSVALGMAPAADAARLEALIDAAGLPLVPPADADLEAAFEAMKLDKKNRSGQLHLVLWRGIGSAEVVTDVASARVRAALALQL